MTFLLIICWDEQTIRNGEAMLERHFILPEGACGEGISKGNIVPLGPPVGVRDPLRRGPGFLLLFSIKSKEERPCFAERVPNWRNTHVAQAKLLRKCALYMPFPARGEGFGKGNLVALSSSAEVWNPLRNGFQVFVTF